ncbi:hypothetical protein [Acidithiobacillus ferriphilus]|uniref:hypothetical protein n=1 Tax=Acidithiobacillus ferriphilus TaxID=1689834 RepID=UPI002DBD823A|nr:hypothetical protein [Acidithiobacillus ferriphilus]MEB8535534.1 hypothetical protein [Acidithiobacillus ferriphilus]
MKINLPYLNSMIKAYQLYFIIAAVVGVYLVGEALGGGSSSPSHIAMTGPDFAGTSGPFGKDNAVSGAAAANRQAEDGLLASRASNGPADAYNNH